MTGNIWIDLQMSLAEIEAEIHDISDELPRIPNAGNAMGQRGLKEAIDDPLPKITQTARVRSLRHSLITGLDRGHRLRCALDLGWGPLQLSISLPALQTVT